MCSRHAIKAMHGPALRGGVYWPTSPCSAGVASAAQSVFHPSAERLEWWDEHQRQWTTQPHSIREFAESTLQILRRAQPLNEREDSERWMV